jgi:biotin carboxylase
MLLAMLIDREAFEIDVPAWAKLWFHWTWYVDRRLHAELLYTVFHDTELDCNDARHLDSAAEANLTIALCIKSAAHIEK